MSVGDLNYEDISSVISKVGCQTYFARKRGRGHIETETVCQDYCLVENISDDVLVIAVADGHGGEAYVKSDIGARLACKTLADSVKNMFNSKLPSLPGDVWIEVIKTKEFKIKYINLWKEAVLQDYEKCAGKEQESIPGNIIKQYGTTILFAIVTKEYLALGQLGDGAILMFNNDNQCQLFKRHDIKINSQTSSLASVRAEYAFVINVFRREMFGNILISTDGIYDKLDKEDSFLTYANFLLTQVLENRKLNKPFEFKGMDISEISRDDCTIALMVSDTPTKKYELKMPPLCEYRNIEFIRAHNGLEIYHAQRDDSIYEIHIADDIPILKNLDVKNCLIKYPQDSSSRPQNKRVFSYALPRGLVNIQKLIEYEEHLEKKYWFNAKDHMPEEDDVDTNLFSNQFWMEIYEKLRLVEKEFEIIKIYPAYTMFDTAYITSDKELLFFADTLRQEGFEKEKLAQAFNRFYEHFGIIGKLSCGKISIPLYRCATQGQNINMLHSADANASLCRVIYNKEKKMYGLFNLSGIIWNVDDGKRKEIAPQGVLRLNRNHSFAIRNVESHTASGAELVDGYARYEVELFQEVICL